MSLIEYTTFIEVIVPPPQVAIINVPEGAFGATLRGPPGSAALEFEQVAVSGGETIITLPLSPLPTVLSSVFINGLRQKPQSIWLAGNIVTLPSTLNIISGDQLNILYL